MNSAQGGPRQWRGLVLGTITRRDHRESVLLHSHFSLPAGEAAGTSVDAQLPADGREPAIVPQRIVAGIDLDRSEIEGAVVGRLRQPREADIEVAERDVDPGELER